VAIALPGPDRLPTGPRREFFEALHTLYDTAGQPGARIISQWIFHKRDLRETVSHETVSAVLRGTTVPAWAKVNSIIVVLAEQSTREHDIRVLTDDLLQLWLAARQPRPADADDGANHSHPAVRVPGVGSPAPFPNPTEPASFPSSLPNPL